MLAGAGYFPVVHVSIMGTGLVTLQCLNPQELANLDGPAEKGADQFKVSSTDNFSKNQQIKFIKIDDQNHLTYDVYTVDSIDGSQHSIHLKEKLKQTYDTANPNNTKSLVFSNSIRRRSYRI